MRPLDSLEAFRAARLVSSNAYRLTCNPRFRYHFALSDQIRRAALSVPANISEGYALGTNAQFTRHLRIALGSSAELQCHLRLAEDLRILPRAELADLLKDNDRLIGLLVGLLKSSGARVKW